MKTVNFFFNSISQAWNVWRLCFVLVLICLGGHSLSAQNNITEFQNLVSVDYSNCDGFATLKFPIHDNDGSNFSNYLRWIDVFMYPPSGGNAVTVGKIWYDNISPNACGSAQTKTVYGRTWNYCEMSVNSSLVVTNGTGFQRFMELTVKDLDESWFGAPIEFGMAGWYDEECCEATTNKNSFYGYGFGHTAEWNNGANTSKIGTVTVSPGGVTSGYPDCQHAIVNWTELDVPGNASCGDVSYNIYRDSDPTPIGNAASTPWTDTTTLVPGQTYVYKIKAKWTLPGDLRADISNSFSSAPNGTREIPVPNGQITVNVKTTGGIPVPGVTCKATLLYKDDDMPGCTNLSPPDSIIFAATDANGATSRDSIFYGHPGDTLTAYIITGMLDTNHISVDTVFLDNTSFNVTADLKDSTSYVITGRILTAMGCGLEDAEVTAEATNSNNLGIVTPYISDADGFYTLVVSSPGDYVFSYEYETANDTITDMLTLNINQSVTDDVDFQYNEKDTIRGFIGGACSSIYGPATVNAYSYFDGDSCLVGTTTSDANTGLYEMILPSHPMTIIVEEYMPTMGPLVSLTVSQSVAIELDSTTDLDFIFLAPINIKILGLPDQICNDINVPILEQYRPYPLVYVVTEGSGCPIETGFMVIYNEIGSFDGSAAPDTLPIVNGFVFDTLIPAIPNIFGNYTKPMTLQAFGGDGSTSSNPLTRNAVIVGAAPRGTQLTTVSPEMPRIILRDPPGDGSYSEIEELKSFSTTTSMYTQDSEGGNVWAKAKAGIKISLVDLEAGITIGGSIGGESSHRDSEETTYEFTTTTSFSTSDHTNINGKEGDVYVGAAMNLTYANSDIISVDLATCTINKRVELVISPDTFSSEFVYAESDILLTVIPDLQTLIDNPSTGESDRHLYQQGINVWHQVINLNAQLKEEAFAGQVTHNQTFTSGVGTITRSFTKSASASKTIEWSQLIDKKLAVEAGFSIQGSGFSAGFEVNLKQEFGESKNNTTTNTTTTKFHLEDNSTNDGINDVFTVDWAFDPVYGTPVFRSAQNAGKTSCPWEIGAKRDKPYFSIPNPIQDVGSGINTVLLQFELGNNSETGEVRDYTLQRVDVSGVEVKVGGVVAQEWNFIDMAVGNQFVNVRVTREPGDPFQFEGLKFKFFPACDESEQQITRFLSVFFKSPCSDIGIMSPAVANGFVINSASNNQQDIVIDGYEYDDMSNSDIVKLEYAVSGSNTFTTSNIYGNKTSLTNNNPAETMKTWDVNGIDDGVYDIRMELICIDGGNQTSTYSERVTGVIDRVPAETLGIPLPEDDDYESGDQIALRFNESLDVSNVIVTMIRQPDNVIVPVTFNYVDSVLKLIITPSYDLSVEIGKSFDVLVTNVEDMYGNISDPFSWEFTVGEIDSDNDGYTDNYEQCIGSAIDLTTPGNGAVHVPHNNTLNIVENGLDFTLEIWFNRSFSFPPLFEETLIGKGAEFKLGFATYSGQTKFFLRLSGEEGISDAFITGGWNHLAVTFDGASKTAQFYLNGLPFGSHTYTTSFISGNQFPMFIGNWTYNGFSFQGRLDDVIIWQHKLTQTEIMATMAGALTGTEPDLIANYDFNDFESCQPNAGNTSAMDKSTNNFNATLYGFSLEGCNSNWATERSMDSDLDGIPDGCDVIEPCFDLQDPGDADGDLLLACADLCPATKDVALDIKSNSTTCFSLQAPLMDTSFTLEAWVNPRDHIREGLVYFAEGVSDVLSFELRYQKIALALAPPSTSGGLGFEYLYSATDVPLNRWSHIAVSYDATTKQATFFLNGIKDGVRQSTLPSLHEPQYINTCLNYGVDTAGNYNYDGIIDDLTFWSRTLSESDIKRTMSAPLSGAENGLEVYFDFNEGIACADNSAVTSCIDKSPNAHSILTNFLVLDGCSSNFVPGRNTDSDADGSGDACDVSCSIDYVVYTTADDGWGSLREAIDCAPSGTTITFSPEIDGLPIQLSSGEIVITNKSLVIQGNGVGLSIIDGSQDLNSRLFNLSTGADVSFRDLNIENGGGPSYSEFGGAIIMAGNANVVLTNCEVKNNQTNNVSGGAFIIMFNGTAKAVNCVFDGNKVPSGRGAVALIQGGAHFSAQQCLFINNESLNLGACIFNSGSQVDLINCTVTNNLTSSGQPVIFHQASAVTNLFNNIIYGNNGAAAITQGGTTLNAQNNLVDIPGQIVVGSNGNFIGDPLFVNAAAGDYSLQNTSLAIDAGNNTALPVDSCDIDNDLNLTEIIEWDLNGLSRVNLCNVDIGAYENNNPGLEYRVTNTMDNGPGSLRDVIACAPAGSTITFASEIDGDSIKISAAALSINKDLIFEGNGTMNTIIDGSLVSATNLISIPGGQVTMRNLTVQNGGGASYSYIGGGILMYSSADVLLENCLLSNNQNGSVGGAVGMFGGNLEAKNCEFVDNYAGNAGSAIYSQGNSTITLSQCLIHDNSGAQAVLQLGGASPANVMTISQSTIVNNVGNSAIFCDYAIIKNNVIQNSGPAVVGSASQVLSSHNLIDDAGALPIDTFDNILGTAQFVDAANRDYHLIACSQGVDDGTTLSPPIVTTMDFDGISRPQNVAIDRGVYEYQGPVCDDADNDGIVDATDLCPDDKDTALDFDGVDDHVTVPHNAALNVGSGDFTIQAWVNPTAPGWSTILSKGTGIYGTSNYIFSINPSMVIGFNIENYWHYSSTTIPMNTWSHVAVSFDFSTKQATFYLNGVADGVGNYPNLPPSDTGPVFIGQQGYDCACNYFEGGIDDIAIWDVAKSQAEIIGFMSYPLTGNEPGLLVHYNFNEAFACGNNTLNTSATDKSTNAFVGSLTNFDLTAGCSSNWTSGRNLDSDNDGVGDACDTPCLGALTLSGNQLSNATYSTDGFILSSQIISSPANIEYNSATSVELIYPFDIQLGATLTIKNDGCD